MMRARSVRVKEVEPCYDVHETLLGQYAYLPKYITNKHQHGYFVIQNKTKNDFSKTAEKD